MRVDIGGGAFALEPGQQIGINKRMKSEAVQSELMMARIGRRNRRRQHGGGVSGGLAEARRVDKFHVNEWRTWFRG